MGIRLRPQAVTGLKFIGAFFAALIAGIVLWKSGLLTQRVRGSQEVARITMPTLRDGGAGTTANPAGLTVTLPSNAPVAATAPNAQNIRMLVFAWNSQMGLMFANGGPVTTAGSLMAEHGIRLTLQRQDDTSQMQAQLVACARELQAGKADCDAGVHYVAIMGDGGAMFLHGLNEQLRRLGPDFTGEVIASAGYSRGEDKFMGPPAWRANPQAARGALIAGVLRDGDWNIAMAWAQANGICNNPDPETYDPNCLNWVGTSSYLEPVEKYNQSACEDRPVVRGNRRTTERQHVCVQGVVTWTPGDVNVVNGPRGGLVSILDTATNAGQMPNAIIGIRRWNRAHRPAVVGFISAIGLGGQAIESDPRALMVASQISHAVYNEAGTTQAYWRTYYLGEDAVDRATGQTIRLGGSKVSNLGEMLETFGLNEGAPNTMADTYTMFGRVTQQQYPQDLPSFDPFEAVSDLSYLREAREAVETRHGAQATHQVQQAAFNPAQAAAGSLVANRSWNITFRTGSAQIDPQAAATLAELRDQLVVISNAYVEIDGHTDNVGDPGRNVQLSRERAQAVADWLRSQAAHAFPEGRVTVNGFGPDRPAHPGTNQDDPSERAANRRVVIELRSNQAGS